MLDALPAELLVRVLMHLDVGTLSCCDQLSRLFHGPPSLVEEALRQLASKQDLVIPKTLGSKHTNWTQALLFVAACRRRGNRQLVTSAARYSACIDAGESHAPILPICHTPIFPMCHAPIPPPLMSAILPADDTYLRSYTCRSSAAPLLSKGMSTPIPGLAKIRVQSISAVWNYTMVLSASGTVYSWGCGEYGQLGHGDKEDLTQPKQIAALSNVCAVATAENHTFAITSDGTLWSWGFNSGWGLLGLLGHGERRDAELVPRPLQVLAHRRLRICAVATGANHTLAVCTGGDCYSWGSNNYGILGIDTQIKWQALPVPVPALCDELVCAVAVSSRMSCAITSTGTLWHWGLRNNMETRPHEMSDATPSPLVGTPLDEHRQG